jgi:hypothetical protein
MQRDPEGSRPTDRARVVLDLIDLWDKFKETFNEVPGLWRSILGLLATPLRWTRSFLSLKGFAAVIGLVIILVVCWFALVVFLSGGHRGDARRAEGEQLMGAARDFARIQYSKTGDVGEAAIAFEKEVKRKSFEGEYYVIGAVLVPISDTTARVYTYPTTPGDTPAYMEFDWASGNSRIMWEDPPRSRR